MFPHILWFTCWPTNKILSNLDVTCVTSVHSDLKSAYTTLLIEQQLIWSFLVLMRHLLYLKCQRRKAQDSSWQHVSCFVQKYCDFCTLTHTCCVVVDHTHRCVLCRPRRLPKMPLFPQPLNLSNSLLHILSYAFSVSRLVTKTHCLQKQKWPPRLTPPSLQTLKSKLESPSVCFQLLLLYWDLVPSSFAWLVTLSCVAVVLQWMSEERMAQEVCRGICHWLVGPPLLQKHDDLSLSFFNLDTDLLTVSSYHACLPCWW